MPRALFQVYSLWHGLVGKALLLLVVSLLFHEPPIERHSLVSASQVPPVNLMKIKMQSSMMAVMRRSYARHVGWKSSTVNPSAHIDPILELSANVELELSSRQQQQHLQIIFENTTGWFLSLALKL